MTLDRESLRCLKYIVKDGADLEVPLKNMSLHFLLDRHLIRIARRYQSPWNGRMHDCVRLEATKEGREALEQANSGSVR